MNSSSKIVTIFFFIFALLPELNACERHGMFLGINPIERTNNFGLMFRSQMYKGSSHTHDHSHSHDTDTETNSGIVREYYSMLDLNARFYPLRDLEVMINLPYSDNKSYLDGKLNEQGSGIADPSLLFRYTIWSTNTSDSTGKMLRQRLQAGLGTKAPVGNFKPEAHDAYNPHILPGTGAWDGIASLNYSIRKNMNMAAASYTFRYSTENSLGYQFAPRSTAEISYFRQIRKSSKVIMMPELGVSYDQAGIDLYEDTYAENTGFDVVFIKPAFNYINKNTAINLAWYQPLMSEFKGDQPDVKGRFMLGFNYFIR